jgi:hypothetical protein
MLLQANVAGPAASLEYWLAYYGSAGTEVVH